MVKANSLVFLPKSNYTTQAKQGNISEKRYTNFSTLAKRMQVNINALLFYSHDTSRVHSYHCGAMQKVMKFLGCTVHAAFLQ